MRVLIIGSLGGELGQAGRIAVTRGARLEQADEIAAAMARLRADARIDLILCELGHDIAWLVRAACRRAHHRPGGRLRHRH